MKKNKSIPFVEIDSIPLLIKDFLTQKISGFEHTVFNLDNISKQFDLKGNSYTSAHRKILVQRIQDQYSGFQLHENQAKNLELLSQENTFTVTTGHQLNLFSGPVFFIYKILQTIKLADFLNEKFPERKVVPIFWLASEDHDFEEINHFQTEKNFYEFTANSGGAVGRIKLQNNDFIKDFEAEFKDAPFGEELISLVKKSYKIGNTLSAATKNLVHEIFSEYGLLVLDGDDFALKSQMKNIFKEELLEQQLFKSTEETVNFLSEKYGKVQVNPREINLFYLTETRNRIEFQNDKYFVVDTDLIFTTEEIFSELENHPEKFSPNALLRPVYQEVILPNLIYIGGNAEIIYWLELQKYFEKINVPFPILIPRVSLLYLKEKTLEKIEKLGFNISDFLGNFETLKNQEVLKNNSILSLLENQEQNLSRQFDDLVKAASSTEKTFGNLVDAEKTRQLKSFDRMRKRLLRAEKIKQKEKLERLDQLYLRVHPGKKWQERTLNFSVFYSDFGTEWLQNCYDEITVDQSELIIVSI